jgi:type IV secretory pathway VirB10-like protein
VRVRAGTLIPARLETALDSDAPGPVLARVVRDVLGADGHTVAIPAGALLLGSVDRDLALGGNRILVSFERLITPEGSLELPQLEGLETAGPRGLADQVNRHTWSALGKAVMLGALGAGFQLSQPERSERATLSSGELVAAQMALELNRVAQELIGRDLGRRPTVKVRAGERFYVFLPRELELPGGAR